MSERSYKASLRSSINPRPLGLSSHGSNDIAFQRGIQLQHRFTGLLFSDLSYGLFAFTLVNKQTPLIVNLQSLWKRGSILTEIVRTLQKSLT